MYTPISTITRATTRKEGDSLNIICMPTHERYEWNLAKTGHRFYAWRSNDGTLKDWDITYAPIPDNYTLLDPLKGNQQLPMWVDFDLVLSQNKFGQFNIAKQISEQLQLPLLSLEHTLPVPSWDNNRLQAIKKMRGHINVFISEFSRKSWLWGEDEAEVIHHGIDTQTFKILNKPRKRHILSVVNDWINRNWCCNIDLWKTVTKDLPVYPVGKTPGLSQPATSVQNLVDIYNEAQIFINTSSVSPVPTALLEAMSCGCAVVSSATCMIPEIIENGVNGYLTNDPKQMRYYLEKLLADSDLCKKLGLAARQTIMEKFCLEAFTTNWNTILYKTAEIII